MIEPKQDFFDRIEQSFIFLKNNVFSLIFPIFIFNFVYFGVIYLFSLQYVVSLFGNIGDSSFDGILSIIYSSRGVLIISIVIFLGLLYALLYIPFLIATFRSIHQANIKGKVNIKENIVYGFTHILDIFRVYWYIFKYIYLIPALLFIFGGIIFNISFFLYGGFELAIVTQVAIIVMISSFLLFIVLSIYRGLQTNFSLLSSVTSEDYSEKNFKSNIKITKNNLLRIFGNFLVIGLIISFTSGFIGTITGIFLPNSVTTNIQELVGEKEIAGIIQGENIDIQNIFEAIEVNISTIYYIVNELVDQVISTLFLVFGFVFTYIFMKRLEYESQEYIRKQSHNHNETIINTEKIKENIDNRGIIGDGRNL